MSFDRGGLTVYQYCSAMLPEWLLLCSAGKIHRLYQMGFAVARIELGKPIDLQLAFCLSVSALCFEIACSLLNMEPSLF
jgi:hypothetical protein